MLRSNAIPLTLATVCGVFTAIAAFQPPLQKEQDKRLGHVEFPRESTVAANASIQDNVISQAIAQDFKEAADVVKARGFAWGIREAVFGKDENGKSTPGRTKTDP